jgi:hypothetical protein
LSFGSLLLTAACSLIGHGSPHFRVCSHPRPMQTTYRVYLPAPPIVHRNRSYSNPSSSIT